MRLVQPLLVLAAAALATGCASITASSSEALQVVSDPPGAYVRVNGQIVGQTPTAVEVPRRSEPAVEVFAGGRQSQFCPVGHVAGGGYIAADVVLCLIFFPVGCLSFIDADGAWNTLSAPYCSVSLPPAGQSFPPAAPYPPPQQAYPPPPSYAPPAPPAS